MYKNGKKLSYSTIKKKTYTEGAQDEGGANAIKCIFFKRKIQRV
jgi:hypothetical protein